MAENGEQILLMEGVSKNFGGVQALEDVDFDRVAMNLNGNYAISFLSANACKYINDKLSLQQIILARIIPKTQVYIRHKFAGRIIQSCFEYMKEPFKI